MRCKQHFSDVSSSVGVCASCLRHRLLHAQSLLNQQQQQQQQQPPPPPPPLFPRSVSPYIAGRKSDDQRRFFSTPQVDPAKKKSKLRAFASLFRSKSSKPSPDPLSKNTSLFALDETSAYDSAAPRTRWFGSRNNNHRGLSPDDPDPDSDSPRQFQTTPSRARVKASPARSHVASGFGICLSPLMRPSPIRQWTGKGEYSGEMRSTVRPHHHLSRGSRSRKLTDVGRFI